MSARKPDAIRDSRIASIRACSVIVEDATPRIGRLLVRPMRRWRLPSAKSEQDKLMPGGHRGQQCKKKGLTDDLFAIHVPLMKTFQACAVATTKSDV